MEEVSFPKRGLFRYEWRGGVFLISLTLISCILVALLTGAGLIPEQSYPPAQSIVLSSSLDPAAYRTVLLDNGLQVTLISNPNATRAAAGIAVKTGWAADPYYFPGRAEYLQKALLKGSRRYPAVDSFDRVLALGAGSVLSSTDKEVSALAFETQGQDFTTALQQFADALLTPSLYPHDSSLSTANLYPTLADVLIAANSTARPTPNLEGVAVRSEIRGLFKRQYVPSNMFAVLAGNYGMQELEQLAATYLGALPAAGNATSESSPNPFSRSHLNHVTFVPTHPGGEKLEVHFALEQSSDPSSSPNKFLEFALGYSGPASPFEALHARGLVRSWTAELRDQGDYADLVLEMGLSELGVQRWQDVPAAIYDFVGVLQSNSTQLEDAWAAFKTAAANLQRYAYFPSLGAKVQSFLRKVLLFGNRNAFLADQVLYTYDEATVLSALNNVVPKRSLVVLWASQAYESAPGPVQEAAGYQFKQQPLKAHSWPQDTSLKTPTVLAFDGGSLGLYRSDLFCKATNSRLNLLSASAGHALWFRRLPDFPVPRTAFSLVLTLPQASASLTSAALLGVLRTFVLNEIALEFAPALQTGARLEVKPIASGLEISLEAWYEGFSNLTHTLFTALEAAFTMSPEAFASSRTGAIDYFMTAAEDLESDLAQSLLFKHAWSKRDLAEVTFALTYTELQAFLKNTYSRQYLELVLSGNFPQDQAETFVGELLGNYTEAQGTVASAEVTLPALAAIQGLHLHRDLAADQTYSLTVHYLWGAFATKTQAAAELLADLFSLRGPLRSTDYDAVAEVSASFETALQTPVQVEAASLWGYSFLKFSLQTTDKAVYAQDLLTMVQSCFAALRTQLDGLSESVFTRDFSAPSYQSFSEVTQAEAAEVATHFYYFNRTQEVLQAKRGLTKAAFLQLYDQHMADPAGLALELFPTASEMPLQAPAGVQVAGTSLGSGFYAAEPRTFHLITKT